MTRNRCKLDYGESIITYQLRTANRKSLEIAVHPDGCVVVKAPADAERSAIAAQVKKRARWIQKQLRYFEQFEPRTPPRQFVGGESHLYLGRSYRLKIAPADTDLVLLKSGFFCISATNTAPKHIAGLLSAWYQGKATRHLAEVFDECWANFEKHGVPKPTLRIMQMKKRWGSLSKNATLTLNAELIKTPRECIEYVVVHELCHLLHHNHGPEFHRLLERSLPDWMERKHKLEMALV